MTPEQFHPQMNRLVAQFGKTTYSSERTAMILREVRGIGAEQWEAIVDRFLGESRHAPLMPEIREAIAYVRERSWTNEKRENENDARRFARQFPMEEIGMICKGITERIRGEMDDQAFGNTLKILQGAAKLNFRPVCSLCTDGGVIQAMDRENGGGPVVFRCHCHAGQEDRRAFPIWDRSMSGRYEVLV